MRVIDPFFQIHGSVGSSLGGMSSLLAAAMHPDSVERFVDKEK